jgi:tRNA1Val (adenine37-N6)-methyltransferase
MENNLISEEIIKIYDDERIDDLERNGYRIIQNPKEFCFGMDAVLLSGLRESAKAKNQLTLDVEMVLFRFF